MKIIYNIKKKGAEYEKISKCRGGGDLELIPQGFLGCQNIKICYTSDIKHHHKNKKAFTLAEVLITLGIIGIVAAVTMPVLIQNSRNKQLEAGLKKGASEIAQALDMYQAENGELFKAHSNSSKIKNELIKYFNVLEDCGFGHSDADSACIKNYGDADKNSNTYKNFNGTNSIDLNKFDDGQFVLADGSLILIENNNNLDGNGTVGNIYLSIDVNGYNKKPNKLGQDLFMFQLDDNGKLIPMGAKGSAFYSENDTYCSKTSTSNMNGVGCTYKALSDPSFWKSLP